MPPRTALSTTLSAALQTGPATQAVRWRPDDLHLTLAGLVLVLLWDLSGLDHAALHLVGHAGGFPWRESLLAQRVLHDGGRWLALIATAVLAANVAWPLWGGLTRSRRLRWFAVTLLCLLLVPALKRLSATSCPWDLAEFGGTASLISHWRFGVADGGPGHCFPSGHATAAFAFIGGWFVLRADHPRLARRWLLAVLLAGLVSGAVQFVRGAHPPSHTLWTAWLCWTLSTALLQPMRAQPRHPQG